MASLTDLINEPCVDVSAIGISLVSSEVSTSQEVAQSGFTALVL
jgi:hypothetical protein